MWIFCISSIWDWLHHFSQFLFMKSLKKVLFKIFLVGEVDNHVAILDSKVAGGCRRSNVGLVYIIEISESNKIW